MNLKKVLQIAVLAMSFGIATAAFAEDAPVYDVDNYPPQFDGQQDAAAIASSDSQSSDDDSPSPAQSYAANEPRLSIDQRVARAEQQIKNIQTDATPKVESLQSQVQSLRGQVEELTHQLQQLQNQQKSMYSDLDKRVATASKAPVPAQAAPAKPIAAASAAATAPTKAATPAAPAVKNTNQPNVAEEQQIYQTAYNLIKAKKYNEAAAQLQKMLQKYPSGQFAANAHYWLGELYGLMGKNEQAISEFSNVVKNYPDSPKIADAQLKLGLIYAGLFKWSDAKSAFKKVINHYPGTSSARLAAEQLKQIKLAGH